MSDCRSVSPNALRQLYSIAMQTPFGRRRRLNRGTGSGAVRRGALMILPPSSFRINAGPVGTRTFVPSISASGVRPIISPVVTAHTIWLLSGAPNIPTHIAPPASASFDQPPLRGISCRRLVLYPASRSVALFIGGSRGSLL